MRNVDDLDLPDDVIRREVAFYLQAGGHSTANALTHTLDEVWRSESPASSTGRHVIVGSSSGACHEALRLHPASPIAQRRALEACVLPSGTEVAVGSIVVADLEAADREPALWGNHANRLIPSGRCPTHPRRGG